MAVAISQRTNSSPRSYFVATRIVTTGFPAFSRAATAASWAGSAASSRRRYANRRSSPYAEGEATASLSTGMIPLPSLPVDSAMSCSSHAPRSWMPGDAINVSLSIPRFAARPRIVPSTRPGFSSAGTPGAQALSMRFGLVQDSLDVKAHHGCGHQAEVGQRRVAPPDALHAGKDVAETAGTCLLVEMRTRIGHGHESTARLIADRLLHAVEEVGLEDVGLERAA